MRGFLLSYHGAKKGNRYGLGARKAWATRNKQGWHRKNDFDKITEMVPLLETKFSGDSLNKAQAELLHRYRSKAKRREVIKKYEDLLKPKS
jgi:hypothetical protein